MTNKLTIKINKIIILILGLTFCNSCSEQTQQVISDDSEWTNLLDENLSEWDTYLSFKHQKGYDGTHPVDESGKEIEPIGLNKPNYNVFSTIEENGETLIKVTGEYYGCLASKKEYENYHFQLKYRWGEKKWVPRLTRLKDSGILYHSIGPFGVEHWRSWMMSQEFQIMEGHTGDFWSQATSAIDIRAYNQESGMNLMAHESQDFVPVGDNELNKHYCMRSNNNEKKSGEWNTLDLICFDGKSLHIVNGEVVMILKNSRYINENGEVVPLTNCEDYFSF